MKLSRVKEYNREDVVLTKFLRLTPIGTTSVIVCDNVMEYNSAKVAAYKVRKEKRSDNYKYKIIALPAEMTFKFTLVRKDDDEDDFYFDDSADICEEED